MFLNSDDHTFEDFIQKTNAMITTEALFDCLVFAVARQGFDRIIFSVPRDLDLPSEHTGLALHHNYPSDWQSFYLEKDFARLDPVLKAAGTYPWAFRWRDIERSHVLTDKQVRFFRLGEEAGLHNGLGVPLHGERAQIAGIALATSFPIRGHRPDLDLISAYCNQFFLCYKRLIHRRFQPKAIVVPLSVKETEVLHWLAAGRSDDEIGQILNISPNTVDTHIRHIFQKYEVRSRVCAVVKGIMSGTINP